MAYASERLVGAQRALIVTSQDIGLKGLEGAARLLQLNLCTIGSLLGREGEPLGSLAVPGASRFYPRPLVDHAPLESEDRTFASYTRQAAEIMSSTNGEIARLVQQQVSGWHSLGKEVLNAALMPPRAASETLQAMMRNPVGVMRWGLNQMMGDTVLAADKVRPAAGPRVTAAEVPLETTPPLPSHP